MCRRRRSAEAHLRAVATAALKHRNGTFGCITSSQKVQSVSRRPPSSSLHPPIHTYCRASTIQWRVPDRGRRWNIPHSREIDLRPTWMQIRDACFKSATNSGDWRPSSTPPEARQQISRCLHARRTNTRRGFVDSRGRHSMRQTRSNYKVLSRSTVSNDGCVVSDVDTHTCLTSIAQVNSQVQIFMWPLLTPIQGNCLTPIHCILVHNYLNVYYL